MPSFDTLVAFAVAAVVFTVVPGPSVLYLVTRSLSQGRNAGFASAAGITTGSLVHVVAAAVGLSALLASSAFAFTVVKYLGAAYLVYLGIRTLLARGEPDNDHLPNSQPMVGIYWQSIVVTVLNPKLAMFMLALLPQFVDPSRGPAALQIAVLGSILVAVIAVNDNCYALLTGTVGTRLRHSTRAMRSGRIATGATYIALGVFAGVTGDRPSDRKGVFASGGE